jgi:hypothetical protein
MFGVNGVTIARAARRRVGIVCLPLSVAAVSLVGAGPASASLLNLGGTCPSAPLTQPFATWGDSSNYQLLPGGDFEGSLAGWTLSGGAGQVAGSESYGVTGDVGSYSLALPAGASALSAPMCITSNYPDFRFFLRSASADSAVRVEVVYRGLLGLVSGLLTPSNGLSPDAAWQPSQVLSTSSGIPTLLGTARLQLRFTGVLGTTQIDDVYVDPHGRG